LDAGDLEYAALKARILSFVIVQNQRGGGSGVEMGAAISVETGVNVFVAGTFVAVETTGNAEPGVCVDKTTGCALQAVSRIMKQKKDIGRIERSPYKDSHLLDLEKQVTAPASRK